MNRRNLKLFLDKPLRWNGEKNKLPILFSWTENTNVRESETYLQRQLLAVSKNLISDWLTPAQQLDPQRINSIDYKEEKHWFIEICQVQHIIHVDHKES